MMAGKFRIDYQEYFLEWQLLCNNVWLGKKKGDETMRAIFSGQEIMSLGSLTAISALRDEIKRYQGRVIR
jgi:hypothetical protein